MGNQCRFPSFIFHISAIVIIQILLLLIMFDGIALSAQHVIKNKGNRYEGTIIKEDEASAVIRVNRAIIMKKNILETSQKGNERYNDTYVIRLIDGSIIISRIQYNKDKKYYTLLDNDYILSNIKIQKKQTALVNKYKFINIKMNDGTIIHGNVTRETGDAMTIENISYPLNCILTITKKEEIADEKTNRQGGNIFEKKITKNYSYVSMYGTYFFTLLKYSVKLPRGWMPALSYEQEIHASIFKGRKPAGFPLLRFDCAYINFAKSDNKLFGGALFGGLVWNLPFFPRSKLQGIIYLSLLPGYCVLKINTENFSGMHKSLAATCHLGYKISFKHVELFLQSQLLYIFSSTPFFSIGISGGLSIYF